MLHPQMEIFFHVVESGSFNKAAIARSCSSVSIMNQINALEDRLGIRLLLRTPQGARLTEAGEIFYREAAHIRRMADEAIGRVKAVSRSDRPVIRLGTSFLRPCQPFLDHLKKLNRAWCDSFQVKIVSFDDGHEEFSRIQARLGSEIDCFVSPCDSLHWTRNFSIFHLGTCRCCVSLSMSHRLAGKAILNWTDLYGETLMLLERGMSPVMDQLRADIISNHPAIRIQDAHNYYDIDVFNRCAQGQYIMESPELWAGLHPALVTIPVEWNYSLPYGVVYSRNPSPQFEKFLQGVKCESQ